MGPLAKLCTRCGRGPHPIGTRCPASTVTCRRCNRKGHYEAQCYSKTVASTNEMTVDTAFLGAVSNELNSSFWHVSALVGDKQVFFKLDTGAQVTAVNEETYRTLQLGPLKKPSKILYGPARQSLDSIGQFTTRLTCGSKSSKQTVFVVRGLQQNLMGLPAITDLHLARRMGEATGVEDVEHHFPTVFSGLGNLGEEYQIKLKEDAVPYSLFTQRNVAIPLREKVRKELEQTEAMGVVSKVS